MKVTDEFLTGLINNVSKRRGHNTKNHNEWYLDTCKMYSNNPLLVWSIIVKYSEFYYFPEAEDEVVNQLLTSDNIVNISENLIALKYPDLQNIFASKIILSGKGKLILEQLFVEEQSLCRDTAIYAILYNAFFNDRNRGTFDIPDYISLGQPEWFVRLFFNDLYRYDGVYKDPIYNRTLANIGNMCKLPETYLKDNLGCILVVIERCYDDLDDKVKGDLYDGLNDLLGSYLFSLTEYNKSTHRIIKARSRLIEDLYTKDLLEHFNDELNKFMVRYEGWCITEESKSCEANKEVAVLLSWLLFISDKPLNDDVQRSIVLGIYQKLQLGISIARTVKDKYYIALEVLIRSLEPENQLYNEIIDSFIIKTIDFYFVLRVISEMPSISEVHKKILQDRWENEKTITVIKVNANKKWLGEMTTIVQKLGFKMPCGSVN